MNPISIQPLIPSTFFVVFITVSTNNPKKAVARMIERGLIKTSLNDLNDPMIYQPSS